MVAETPNSVTDPGAIRERLERIKRDGYCWVWGELTVELNSVAAPVFGRSAVIGAISVHGPAFRFPGDRDPVEIGERVADVAASLSHAHRAEL